MSINKTTALGGAMAMALGMAADASALTALSIAMDFKGYVTMLDPNGRALQNTSLSDDPEYQGFRTPIIGRMVMDITETGMVGTATFDPFLFLGTESAGRDVTFIPADTLFGTPVPSSTLLVGNMLFDFGETRGIPVSIVLDIGNLSTALMSASVGDVFSGMLRAASEDTVMRTDTGKRTLPLGPVVVATTTWNTTDVDTDGDGAPGPIAFDVNPSGTVPLLVDTVVDATNGDIGIGGSPLRSPPFTGFSPNFDITGITVTCVAALGACDASGIPLPPLPISPEPLDPILGGLGGLFKKFGL